MTEREPLYTVNAILESLPDYPFESTDRITYAEMYGSSLVFMGEDAQYYFLRGYKDLRPMRKFFDTNKQLLF